MLLRILTLLTAATTLACTATAAGDLSTKALPELSRSLPGFPLVWPRAGVPFALPLDRLSPPTLTCAIPLRELRTGVGAHIDPIAHPSMPTTFDKIARPAPVQACPSH
jgi:hypothetical protein